MRMSRGALSAKQSGEDDWGMSHDTGAKLDLRREAHSKTNLINMSKLYSSDRVLDGLAYFSSACYKIVASDISLYIFTSNPNL